ncbi:MAG: Holliday junction resolvase RuvX [Candidatus Paceibacterota bacterium]
MRYLGIDYGTKRVGISLSDEMGKMAFPHAVIDNDKKLFDKIISLINERQVGEIVVGHSVDKKGKANEIHKLVEELITDLTLETGLPIHLEPEQFTTQAAIRTQGRNNMTDASAAALILEGFLSRR